jgi:hypothetical protein
VRLEQGPELAQTRKVTRFGCRKVIPEGLMLAQRPGHQVRTSNPFESRKQFLFFEGEVGPKFFNVSPPNVGQQEEVHTATRRGLADPPRYDERVMMVRGQALQPNITFHSSPAG